MFNKDIVIENEINKSNIESLQHKMMIEDEELATAILKIGRKHSKKNETMQYSTKHTMGLVFSIGKTGVNLRVKGTLVDIFKALLVSTIFRSDVDAKNSLELVVGALWNNIGLVKKNQMCVFYQAINWQKNHGYNASFKVTDIFPDKDCKYREYLISKYDDSWSCPFYQDEYCDLLIGEYKTILDSMCPKIFEKVSDDEYKFIF